MQEDVKNFVFESLPEGPGKWIVIAWGRIINERKGSYEQEVLFRRMKDIEASGTVVDLMDPAETFRCKLDLGSIRLFGPGTIVSNQKIVQFVHEHLKRRTIEIGQPGRLVNSTIRDLLLKPHERVLFEIPAEKAKCRVFMNGREKIAFPCDVIADYYYYGRTYLIKAVMEGRLSDKYVTRNDVYDPQTLLEPRVTPTGKTVVRVELQRRMSNADRFTIARLAFDNHFRSKCLDIHKSLLLGNPLESYIDTDFPIDVPVTLELYGSEVRGELGRFFLVHSISWCSSKPPFDVVIAAKKFAGKAKLPETDQGSGDTKTNDGTLDLSSKAGSGKKRRKTRLSRGGKSSVGGGKANHDSDPEDIPFNKNQSYNFPMDAAINEEDFADPDRIEDLEKLLSNYGIAAGLTTNPIKSGSSNSLQLNFFNGLPLKDIPAPPTTAFERIENFSALIELALADRHVSVSMKVRCPVVEGVDKYSAFPVAEIMKLTEKRSKEEIRQFLNFCFLNVKIKKHTHHRRVFIKECSIEEKVFYIMDVEPKYKSSRDGGNRWVALFAVIFCCGTETLTDEQLKEIMMKVVTTDKTMEGKWNFLAGFEYPFQRLKHTAPGRPVNSALRFISRLMTT